MDFQKNLKAMRQENNMTQRQLASKLYVSYVSIWDWENRGLEPNYEILCEIAKIFDVTVGQLLGTEEY